MVSNGGSAGVTIVPALIRPGEPHSLTPSRVAGAWNTPFKSSTLSLPNSRVSGLKLKLMPGSPAGKSTPSMVSALAVAVAFQRRKASPPELSPMPLPV